MTEIAQEVMEGRLRWEAEEREVRNRLQMELLNKQLETVSASIENAESDDRQSARDPLTTITRSGLSREEHTPNGTIVKIGMMLKSTWNASRRLWNMVRYLARCTSII